MPEDRDNSSTVFDLFGFLDGILDIELLVDALEALWETDLSLLVPLLSVVSVSSLEVLRWGEVIGALITLQGEVTIFIGEGADKRWAIGGLLLGSGEAMYNPLVFPLTHSMIYTITVS